MAGYGEAGYIGGRSWPRSITITRPAATPTPTAAAKPTLSAEARTAWREAIGQYGPEGGFGKGVEAGLGRGRTKALASGMQSLVSAGLAGTTVAAGLGKRYEEEVAMPARARVEEARAEAISRLQAGLAGAEQRGYETAEERALRERLGTSQLGLGYAGLGAQTGLGYAQLESRERVSARDLALQEMMAKMKMTREDTGGYGGGYGSAYAGGGYGGDQSAEPARNRWEDWMGAYISPEEYMSL